ncbi:ATP-binding cassette domain-containing protein [Lutimonas saemankumensis]|uniref:ABC transporter ATP-binding protein n=1 Tax=Lutimonas saemankumensis TaxID=483016 RepID=UPI001CD5170F|nr:ATP-binding cassette domain-containing protein [Lutimonas saemankumensis]MCA0931992.1 ATP-binding cassette domain-containing protein [Lutimonas saemankumensis]
MENILVAENIVKNYGSFKALNRVSLEVPRGSIFGLLGPNGAGKTTFIRIINQITLPDEGVVYFDGKPLAPDDVHYIGYLPEERGLYKRMKIGEQALYLAQLKGMSKRDARQKLRFWFEKFDIGPWWNKKVEELSKGMAQKLQFIITVLHEPKLLIFDEPFSGFDPINANLIKEEILNLQKQGASIIFSTHRMESVEELCEYIALIHQSNKVLDGKLLDIKRAYKTNTYEVGLSTDNKLLLEKELKEKFELSRASFKSLEDDLKVNIKLRNGSTSSDLIRFLNSKASITHYNEIIPTANDIFIQTVNMNS